MDIAEDVLKAADELFSVRLGDDASRGAGEIKAAIIAAILAERERAAKVCETQAQTFLSPEYATGQPLSSFSERFACDRCASAIRSGER